MNFKVHLLFILVCACGVKGNPVSPQGAHQPSVMDNYPDIKIDQQLKDSKLR